MKITYEDLVKNLIECCEDVYEQPFFERCNSEPAVLAASAKCERLYAEIHEKLGKDSGLIREFDDANALAESFKERYILEFAFRECVHLLRWMELL